MTVALRLSGEAQGVERLARLIAYLGENVAVHSRLTARREEPRIGGQIFIGVAHAFGQVQQASQRRSTSFGSMMPTHGFDECSREFPLRESIRSHLGMRAA